ncbi:hypothetical protein Droror1_Dr00010592 [Drosera rotundifolia]
MTTSNVNINLAHHQCEYQLRELSLASQTNTGTLQGMPPPLAGRWSQIVTGENCGAAGIGRECYNAAGDALGEDGAAWLRLRVRRWCFPFWSAVALQEVAREGGVADLQQLSRRCAVVALGLLGRAVT